MRCRILLRRLLLFACAIVAVYISGRLIITSQYSPIKNQLNSNIRDFTGGRFSRQWNPPTVVWSPRRRVFNVSCSAIIDGDENETTKAKSLMENYTRPGMSDEDLVNVISDCNDYKRTRGYLEHAVTEEERAFPIAFSILLYKEVEQAERLLRAIYRPHNLYCMHVDADSPTVTHKAVDKLAACFDNVFVVSRKEYMVYAGLTRLQADLNCMHDILKDKSWKYFINLPSQEFPLKTNLEMVKILKIYNGSNDIQGNTRNINPNRYEHRFKYKHMSAQLKLRMFKTNEKKNDPLPYNISIVKGSAYGTFSRAFVEFVQKNRIARDLLDWCRDVYSPDEYYWATLHYNPQIGTPGAFKGKPDAKPFISVYVNWQGYEDPCEGKVVRGICVFGVGDLKHLVHRKQFFANKFYQEFQPMALDCMEEWMYNKTAKDDYFNTSYYEELPFVRRR